jgi:adenylyl- and sulfurtransferase ThiI
LRRALFYSGGLDSLVLLKALRPKQVVHFIIDPKVTKLAILTLYYESPNVNLHLFDHREYLRRVKSKLRELGLQHYLCEACKRGMVERASQLFDELIMGDSVGQVASQTLSNMSFITNGKTIIRPLGGSDKEDIEEFLSGIAARISRRVSRMACPWKPMRVATATKGKAAELVEGVVLEELSSIKYLGMRSARELTAMG